MLLATVFYTYIKHPLGVEQVRLCRCLQNSLSHRSLVAATRLRMRISYNQAKYRAPLFSVLHAEVSLGR